MSLLNLAGNRHPLAPGAEAPLPGPNWYTHGRSDGFGDRLLMFDSIGPGSVQMLRFHGAVARTDGFATALQERVDALADFQHRSFAPIRRLQREDDRGLMLVSAHQVGKRLAELFTPVKPLPPAFVAWMIGDLSAALAALQERAGVVHGAITDDRITLTAENRLVIAEHVLGGALDSLAATATRFWREFGLIVPAADDVHPARVDASWDVVQLAMASLASLVGRRLTLDDYRQHLPELLNEFEASASHRDPLLVRPLRAWLQRALQVADAPFKNAAMALADLGELASVDANEALASLKTVPPLRPVAKPDEDRRPTERTVAKLLAPVPTAMAGVPAPAASQTALPGTSASRRPLFLWIAAALGVLVLVQTALIVRLLSRRPQPTLARTTPSTARPAAPAPPAAPAAVAAASPAKTALALVAPTTKPVAAVGAKQQNRQPRPPADAGDANPAIAAAAARPRPGGVFVTAPVELDVLEGDTVLGKTGDAPIIADAGDHVFDLVNAALGIRIRRAVTLKAGQIEPLTVTLPTGRLSVNAQPWADVFVDGQAVGQTPLANISVAVGSHEVVFKHPQFGEARQTVTVRGDRVTRVGATLGPQ